MRRTIPTTGLSVDQATLFSAAAVSQAITPAAVLPSFLLRRAPHWSGMRWLVVAGVSVGVTVVACKLAMFWLKHTPLWQWQQDMLVVPGDSARWHDGENAEAIVSLNSSILPQPIASPDALLVLGYSVDHFRGCVTAPLEARLSLALTRACADPSISTVIFTGGADPARVPLGLPSEAQIMSEWFQKRWMELSNEEGAPCQGRPMPRLLLEHTSTSTLENALYTLGIIMREEQDRASSSSASSVESVPSIRRIEIVTNRFHQRRALATFMRVEKNRRLAEEKALASSGSISAVTTAPFLFRMSPMPLADSRQIPQMDFWRELAATALYAFKGWI